MSNAIMVIFPYQHQKTWVFDDERVGLLQEQFGEHVIFFRRKTSMTQ